MKPVQDLAIQPLCATGAALTWEYAGEPGRGFEIERQQTFEDQSWHRVATVPAASRRYESVGLLNAPGRSWRHRVRAVGPENHAGPWSELPPISLPQYAGPTRGVRIVAGSAAAPRNIAGSFIRLANGELLYAYTASAGKFDYSISWLPAIALKQDGTWEDRGILFPTRPDWPVVSRPSFCRLPNGHIGVTYSIGKRKPGANNDHVTRDFIHRTVFRASADEAKTWSDERIISDQLYDYELVNSNGTRNVVLSNGRVITSVHVCWPPSLRKFAEQWWNDPRINEIMGTYLLYSDDSGQTWQRYPREPDGFFYVGPGPFHISSAAGFHETTLVEYEPGKLLLLGRTVTGYLYECRSSDFGTTWSEPARTEIMQSPSPPNLTRIPGTSTIVLIHNPLDIPRPQPDLHWEISRRQILATRLSDDGGQTWHGYRELEYAPYEPRRMGFIYPDYLWDADVLHVVYCRNVEDLYHQRLSQRWLRGEE